MDKTHINNMLDTYLLTHNFAYMRTRVGQMTCEQEITEWQGGVRRQGTETHTTLESSLVELMVA